MKHRNGLKTSLYQAGVVADLTVSKWSEQTKLTPEDLGLEKFNVEEKELIRLGKKVLLHKGHLAKVRSCVWEAQTALYDNSFKFPFGATQFVPYAKLPKLMEIMERCKKNFYDEVEAFIPLYGQARAEVLAEYDVFFEKILRQRNGMTEEELQFMKRKLLQNLEGKYPSESELRDKFKFEFSVFEVSLPEFKGISDAEAIDKARLNAEMEQQYRKMVMEKIDRFVYDVIQQLRQLALDTVAYLKKRIEGGQVNLKTVKAFEHYARTFKDMDFVGFDVQDKINQIQHTLTQTALDKEALNDEEFQKKLVAMVDEIHEEVTHTDIDKVLGKFKRRIEMEDEVTEEIK